MEVSWKCTVILEQKPCKWEPALVSLLTIIWPWEMSPWRSMLHSSIAVLCTGHRDHCGETWFITILKQPSHCQFKEKTKTENFTKTALMKDNIEDNEHPVLQHCHMFFRWKIRQAKCLHSTLQTKVLKWKELWKNQQGTNENKANSYHIGQDICSSWVFTWSVAFCEEFHLWKYLILAYCLKKNNDKHVSLSSNVIILISLYNRI